MEHRPSPAISLYGQDGRRKYLAPPERARFIEAAWRHPRAELGTLCLFLAFTGCRISEALAMTAGAMETAERFAAIVSLKKRGQLHVRTVPLPGEIVARMRDVHRLDNADPETRLWRWSRGRAWFLVKQAMIAAKVPAGPHATAKGLRHGFGIHAVRCGMPLNLVQRWLGHASLSTTAIYADAIGDEERELAARMWTTPS